jgi:hypothetical protein
VLASAPEGVVICSFGATFHPDSASSEAIIAALAKLSPVRVTLKNPSTAAHPLSSLAQEMLRNSSNIVVLPWLPQVWALAKRSSKQL